MCIYIKHQDQFNTVFILNKINSYVTCIASKNVTSGQVLSQVSVFRGHLKFEFVILRMIDPRLKLADCSE